ncbi:MAG: glycosyltransferase family 8 protein [Alphaproteobacteria bacterium]|nr:glycosyltransferase family 8 protein [Alphaproteobacteria bacterium]
MTDNTLHLCTAADNNYVLPLSALINSICKNSASHPTILHVLCSGFSQVDRQYLLKCTNNTNVSIDFIDMDNFNCDFIKFNMQHWTKAIFYRIMIPKIFNKLSRIIYIDGDTLVLKDLYSLFTQPLQENTFLGMAVDKFSYKERRAKLGTSNYYNSGVILFDLEACRENNFSENCINWMYNNANNIIYPDQDAINKIADGHIMRLSNIYNSQQAPQNTFKINPKINPPFIMHFLSAIKPWMPQSSTQLIRIYMRYIPSISQRIKLIFSHYAYLLPIFLFHTKNTFKMQPLKVIEEKQYYICNILVYKKTIKNDNNDIISFLKSHIYGNTSNGNK